MIISGIKKYLATLVDVVWVGSAVLVLSGLVVGLPIGLLAGEDFSIWLSTPLGSLLFSVLLYLVALILVLLPLRIRKLPAGSVVYRLGLERPFGWKMISWSALGWVVYFVAVIFVMALLVELQIPGLDLNQSQDVGFSNLSQLYEYMAAFLALVVLAPVFEELIFRGYLFGNLRRRHKFWTATIITSLVFGFVHLQFNVAVDVFVMSLMACYLRERLDSVWPAIFLHAFKNGVAYVIIFIAPLYGPNLIQ